MPTSPDCPRCHTHLVIPDATTEKEFVKQARRVWHAAHPKKSVGQPKTPLETTVSIIEMLFNGQSVKDTSKTLDVKESRVRRERTRIHGLLGIRQHGAKPDRFSIEDARARVAQMPHNELIAMFAATITAKDILPE